MSGLKKHIKERNKSKKPAHSVIIVALIEIMRIQKIVFDLMIEAKSYEACWTVFEVGDREANRLLNIIGEMVIPESAIEQLVEDLKRIQRSYPEKGSFRDRVDKLLKEDLIGDAHFTVDDIE